MNPTDRTGHRVSGANAAAIEAYDQAGHQLLCLVDDPVASVERALAASPEMTMAKTMAGSTSMVSSLKLQTAV